MPAQPTNPVSVTDVDMPFLSMVRFMVKWAIAAIPAFIILMILGALFWGVILGTFGARLLHKVTDTAPTSAVTPTVTPRRAPPETQSPSSTVDRAAAEYLPLVVVQNVR